MKVMRHRERIMNLPNKITTVRFFLIPVFVVCFLIFGPTNPLPGLVFVIASLTDFLDGYLARKHHLVTTFGKFMDPLADKVLTQAAFIMLIGSGHIPAWIVVVIVARELMITGFRTVAASDGVTIAASKWGKFKTTFQMLAIIVYLTKDSIFAPLGLTLPPTAATALLYLALVFTLISGVDYIAKNLNVLDLEHI